MPLVHDWPKKTPVQIGLKKHMLGAEGTKSQKGEPELSLLSLVKFRYCKKDKIFEKISNFF